MKKRGTAEISTVAQVALTMTICSFSFVLVILNILLGWEGWPIPLLVAAGLGSVALYVSNRLPRRIGLYFFSMILIVEVFYYTVNAQTTFDSTPVIVLMLVILAMTQEPALPWIGFAVTDAGVLFGIFLHGRGAELFGDLSSIVRTQWHLILLVIAVVTVERLLSMIKGVEEGMRRRIDVLEEENAAASDFLTNVSHELRTPTNAVIGLAGLSIEEETDSTKVKRLRSIYEASSRVAQQVSDIMDYSEIEMGSCVANEDDYMISSLLVDLNAELAPLMKKEVEVIFDVDSRVPSIMRTDVAKLKKILWHLIGNGIKFTREGGVYVHITCEKQTYGVNLKVTVKDTGIGMDVEQEMKSFHRFYQANSRRTRESGGLGLGIPIILGFLKVLGGFIYLESTPDEGTIFRVTIPQTVVDDSPCLVMDDPEGTIAGTFFSYQAIAKPEVREFYHELISHLGRGVRVPVHRAENIENFKRLVQHIEFTHIFIGALEYSMYTDYLEGLAVSRTVCVVCDSSFEPRKDSRVRIMRKPISGFPIINVLNNKEAVEETGDLYLPDVRVLVVDDEPMNLTVAAGLLGKYGMEVLTADSGLQAIEICAEQDFDMVFMDHMMPQMDGVEAMKRIRAEAKRKGEEFPFVALTANALSSAREMFMKEGFDGFVSKPVETPELERVLKKLLPKSVIRYRDKADIAAAGTNAEQDREPKDWFAALAELGIDPAKGMHYSKEDAEFYKLLLRQFAGEASDKKERSDAFLEEGDLHEYAVIAHSIKGTAKMIGAEELSEQARRLEMAAKAKRDTEVRAGHAGMFSTYRKTADGIILILGEDGGIGGAKAAPAGKGKMFEFLPKGGEKR